MKRTGVSADRNGPIYDPKLPRSEFSHAHFFSHSERYLADRIARRALTSVGPGQYECKSTLNRHNARTFGVGFRAYDKVLFPGLEKEHLGRNSTGPATVHQEFGEGVAHGFARSQRMLPAKNLMPAPGTYDAHEVLTVAKLKSVESERWNPVNVKMRKPAVLKPRLDYRRLRSHSHTLWGLN
jgi:hypothetical protein